MTLKLCIYRRGMSLVELLVVVAIIGVLAVTVLPNISSTSEARRGREATRSLTSFMAQSQSQAIGRKEWAGFTVSSLNPTSFAATDLSRAAVPEVYRGDTVPALLRISGAIDMELATRLATGSSSQIGPNSYVSAGQGDLVIFNGRGPTYEIRQMAGNPDGTCFIQFAPRGPAVIGTDDLGQTPHNTSWPPSDVPLSFEIFRQPVSGGSPFTVLEGRVIDLYWSGYGPPGTSYVRFATAGSQVTVLFDGTGRLRQLFVRTAGGASRISVSAPVFFLLGRADRATGNPNAGSEFNLADDTTGANWQYADSYWVAVDPTTGSVKSAECRPGEDRNGNGTLDVGEDSNGNGGLDSGLAWSQTWVRESLVAGGR